jgi:GNAT superfamily N-acetyltransferase
VKAVQAAEGLYFVYCIHVPGHKQGRGNFQGHGMGTALLCAAEEDARRLGAKGMAAWGVWLPFWMKASWFKKHVRPRVAQKCACGRGSEQQRDHPDEVDRAVEEEESSSILLIPESRLGSRGDCHAATVASPQ